MDNYVGKKGPILEVFDAYAMLVVQNNNLKENISKEEANIDNLMIENSVLRKFIIDHISVSAFSDYDDLDKRIEFTAIMHEKLTQKDLENLFGKNWVLDFSKIYDVKPDILLENVKKE